MEPLAFDLGNGGVEQHDVVAVRARGGPPDRDPRPVDRDRPLPAEFSPVHRAFAGPFPTTRGFVGGPVDAHVIEIESHDPVIGSDRFGRDQLEHPSSDPLVAARPQRRVRHLPSQQRLRALPRAARRQAHQDPPKAQPVRYPGPMPPAGGTRTGRTGSIGSTAAQITSTTSGSKARMMKPASTGCLVQDNPTNTPGNQPTRGWPIRAAS